MENLEEQGEIMRKVDGHHKLELTCDIWLWFEFWMWNIFKLFESTRLSLETSIYSWTSLNKERANHLFKNHTSSLVLYNKFFWKLIFVAYSAIWQIKEEMKYYKISRKRLGLEDKENCIIDQISLLPVLWIYLSHKTYLQVHKCTKVCTRMCKCWQEQWQI